MLNFVKLLTMLFLLGAATAQALTIESGYIQDASGSYLKATKILCENEERSSCLSICENESFCQRVEPFCRNCAGTSSHLMRQLFTDISRLYKVKGELQNPGELVQYLAAEKYVLLDFKSIFNYYTPLGSDEFLADLQSFCGVDAQNALLAVSLDSVNQPFQLKYVLCRNPQNRTLAFEVESRHPEVGGFRPLQTPLIFQAM